MRKIIRCFMILMAILCLSACQKAEKEIAVDEAEEVYSVPEEQSNPTIFVNVCGAVVVEGVYELPEGSRVFHAIEAAGGFREDAAAGEVNQAQVLQDEEHLYVPTVEETNSSMQESDGKVNINRATKEELMTLPGVGASRAESIIQYRKEHGSFQSTEEIMLISGIKEALYAKIKDLIRI